VSRRPIASIRTSGRSALALAVALSGSGCLMTKSAGDELRAEADARDRRIQQLEAESRRSKEEIDAKLRELQQVLDQATAVLKRGSADVGAQVEQMRDQVAKLEGESAELRHKLELLDQQFMAQRTQFDEQLAKGKPGAKELIDPAQIPADRAAHYKAAYDAYQAADYDRARGLWREYLTRYPTDPKAGDAQYWIGATYTQQNKPATALGEYRKVIADHGKSNAVNVALYGMADAFYRLHACTDAKNALQALIKRKPDASLGDRARKLLKDLERPPKGFCTS
jgi:tol-pal system protein YbgF